MARTDPRPRAARPPTTQHTGRLFRASSTLTTRISGLTATLRGRGAGVEADRSVVGSVWDRVHPVLTGVSPLGWTTLLVGLAAWIGGAVLGWVELVMIGVGALVLVALAALMTIGRTRLQVRVDLSPSRVVAGNPAAGRVRVVNTSHAKLLPVVLELPIGVSAARFNLPRLHTGMGHEELFSISTERRGVIPVGPARTVRGDPFGLLRRTVVWTGVKELVVHPVTVPIEQLGAGLLRDLEGQTTNEVSVSDLAFHTLREYAPGDDRRYIHWRSSAKRAGLGDTGPGSLLVRQFLDTRRSHVAVVVDGRESAYSDPIDFETAISAGASVARRALTDDVDTTVVASGAVASEANVQLTMDTFSRADFGAAGLPELARHCAEIAPMTTVALLVTGARTSFTELRQAGSHFTSDVNVVAVRVDPDANAALAMAGTTVILTLPELTGLARLLAGGVAP